MAQAQTDQPARTKTDQRQTYRIAVTQPVAVAITHGLNQSDIAALKELSESGCLIQCHRLLGPGERLTLILDLPQAVCISEARVVWSNEARCGLEFVRVSPVERSRLWRFLWKHLSQATVTDLQPLIAIAEEPHYSRTGFRLLP